MLAYHFVWFRRIINIVIVEISFKSMRFLFYFPLESHTTHITCLLEFQCTLNNRLTHPLVVWFFPFYYLLKWNNIQFSMQWFLIIFLFYLSRKCVYEAKLIRSCLQQEKWLQKGNISSEEREKNCTPNFVGFFFPNTCTTFSPSQRKARTNFLTQL